MRSTLGGSGTIGGCPRVPVTNRLKPLPHWHLRRHIRFRPFAGNELTAIPQALRCKALPEDCQAPDQFSFAGPASRGNMQREVSSETQRGSRQRYFLSRLHHRVRQRRVCRACRGGDRKKSVHCDGPFCRRAHGNCARTRPRDRGQHAGRPVNRIRPGRGAGIPCSPPPGIGITGTMPERRKNMPGQDRVR
jgi:hypothetical protein